MFLNPILITVLIGGLTLARPQQYNDVYYTPYGASNQYNNPYQQPMMRRMDGQPYPGQAPCARSIDDELNDKVGRETGVPIDAQQPAAVPEAPCDKPGSENMPLEVMCSLPPDKGTGDDDIFRYYFNPVVQQCIPFSYSGKGGNANRFVSVKNCYEICHPADPTVKKPRVVSGIKAYLVPNLKSDCDKSGHNEGFDRQKGRRKQPKEVVIRQIPHPLDPTKTLTIIQNAHYVTPEQVNGQNGGLPNGPTLDNALDTNVRRLYQYETVPQFMDPYGQPYGGQSYGR